jgi:hypothetical protein
MPKILQWVKHLFPYEISSTLFTHALLLFFDRGKNGGLDVCA